MGTSIHEREGLADLPDRSAAGVLEGLGLLRHPTGRRGDGRERPQSRFEVWSGRRCPGARRPGCDTDHGKEERG
jgi:hypothetical protein